LCNASNHSSGCTCGFGPPYNKSLPQYFDELVGDEGGKDLSAAGPDSERLGSLLDNSRLTTRLISTFLWQSYIGSSAGGLSTRAAKALIRKDSPAVVDHEASPAVYIVPHGRDQPRHDLLIFDPKIPQGKVHKGYVDVSDADLRAGWVHFRDRYDLSEASVPRWMSGFRLGEVPEIAAEAMAFQRHFFVAMHPPRIVWTSGDGSSLPQIPTGAIAVSKKMDSKKLSTAGIISTDAEGRTGITTALHAFMDHDASVFVDGVPGTVRARDVITDSCFIEVDFPNPPLVNASNGPLTGVTPRIGDLASFVGIASEKVDTFVQGWTPELPWVLPGVQSRILTPPVTDEGDSGAALVDKDENIIGFAFYRTGYNARCPHSAWIWAESVFSALNLNGGNV
jgi:hypothetical protein